MEAWLPTIVGGIFKISVMPLKRWINRNRAKRAKIYLELGEFYGEKLYAMQI